MEGRKGRFITAVLVALLILTVAPGVYAQSAKNASWVVSVTYQNVGDGPATVNVSFYEEGSATAIDFNPLEGIGDGTLARNAGASFYIGNVNGLSDGWRGGAIMMSDQPLVASVVQFSQDANFRMRLLSNGFQSSATSEQYLIATTLLNKFNRTTVFSVQNVQNESIDATIKFYDADAAGAMVSEVTHTIPANSVKYIDMSVPADTGLPASTTIFNGSAIVTAVLTSDTTAPAEVVAAASEYYTDRPVAANFEGIPLGEASATVYVATGLCENFGLDTFYAVQNASLTDDAYLEVTYRDKDGNTVATDGRYAIGPGEKKSIRTCSPSDGTDMSGFTGSAVVRSYDAMTGTTNGAPLAIIGKAQNSIDAGEPSTSDVFTAFLGQGSGASELALPYIRWATNADYGSSNNTGGRQRAYIAVQNVQNTSILVDVSYYDKNGNLEGSETLDLAPYAKGNSNPNKAAALGADNQFGYYGTPVTSYGGSVTVKANAANPAAEFVAIVRVQHPGAGEDYNGIPVQ